MKPALNQQAARATTGTQNWTDASITGDQTLQLFFGTEATANNTTTASGKMVLGATDLTHNAAITNVSLDATSAASANTSSVGSSTASIIRTTSGGGESVIAAVSATLSNGLTMNYTTADAGTYLYNALSLAGSDHDANQSFAQFATTDTSKVITHGLTGGAPEQLILWITHTSTGTDVAGNPANTTIVFWDGTNSTSVSTNFSTQPTTPTNLKGRITTDAGHYIDNSGTDIATFSIGSVGATTFTLTRSATGSVAAFVSCIAFRHLSGNWSAQAGIATLPTSTGNAAFITGMAVQPQVLITVPTRLTSTALAANSDAAGSLGFCIACNNAGTTQQMATAMTEKNAVATTVSKCYVSNSKALVLLDNTGTPTNLATVQSWDSGGVTLNHSAVGASGFQVMYLAFGISNPSTTLGLVPRPGSPALNAPRNLSQFIGVGRVSAPAPIIAAPLTGLSVSMSVAYGPSVPPASGGFIPQPGPGSAGPFNNGQFISRIASTSNPSASVGALTGLSVSMSTLFGDASGSPGALSGLSVSQSVAFGPGSILTAGQLSGLSISSSVAYGQTTGIGELDGLSASMSLVFALPPTPPPTPVIIPNVVGLEDQVAIAQLLALGFVVTLVFDASMTIPEDFVDAQNPAPGPFSKGGNVTITISTGIARTAGMGGSKWGAGGGGITPVGSPDSVLETMAEAERQANYQITIRGDSVAAEMSKAELSGQTPDDLLPLGGNTSGNPTGGDRG